MLAGGALGAGLTPGQARVQAQGAGQAQAQGQPQGQPQGSGDGVQSVASAKELMELLVIPASNAVFDAGAEPPMSDEAWAAVRRQAVILAESANLLMVGSRVPDQGDWMRMSRAQLDAALEVIRAVDARNGDALSAAGDAVYATCDSCHTKYMDKTR